MVRLAIGHARVVSVILAILVPFALLPATAADTVFDDGPLKIIVGMPVGGGVDAYGRLVQKHLQRFLRNRGKFPGRGGSQRLESMIQAWDDNAHS